MIRKTQIAFLFTFFLGSTTGIAQKNSVIIQVCLFNHFYDKKPILMNTSFINKTSSFKSIYRNLFIESIGLNYSRNLSAKSNLSVEYGYFRTEYIARSASPLIGGPAINARKWHFLEISYNRNCVDTDRFRLYYGGGIRYRQGHENYHVSSSPAFTINGQVGYESYHEFTGKKDLGVTFNMNLKYVLWKSLFLYSKIDVQYYFHDFAKNDYDTLVEKFATLSFPRTKQINHTFTIGVGYEF